MVAFKFIIQVNEVKMAFGELTPEEFEDRYDFPRPKRDPRGSPIIITCRSGVRATKAAEAMLAIGFNAAVYKGSMLDWAEKGGKVLEVKNKKFGVPHIWFCLFLLSFTFHPLKEYSSRN